MHVVCRHEAPLASWNEHFSHSIIYSFMTRGNSVRLYSSKTDETCKFKINFVKCLELLEVCD